MKTRFGLKDILHEHSWTIAPVVYNDGTEIGCPQAPVFGFYCLSTAIRSTLLAVNHALGARTCSNVGLNAPSVLLSYTAAYHALTAYLALEGRVIIDAPVSPAEAPHQVDGPVIGLLKRDRSWCFEGLKRNHQQRWNKVLGIYRECPAQLPSCFSNLFSFLYRGQFKPGIPDIELLRDPGQHRLQLVDKVDEFVGRITRARHSSLYQSFGDDPAATEALVNDESLPAKKKWGQSPFSRPSLRRLAADGGSGCHGASGLRRDSSLRSE